MSKTFIDWFYTRKGWVSSKRAQEFLEQNKINISQVDFSKDKKFDAVQAWDLVRDAHRIFVSKGKKSQCFDPKKDDQNEILKKIIGPSGNLRAPTIRKGKDFLVGFNEVLFGEQIKKNIWLIK